MARLYELPKYPITVFRDDSVSSDLQVPAVAAKIDVYREGATIRTGPATVGAGATVTVDVYDIGAIVVGDNVFGGVNTSILLEVRSFPTATSIELRNNGGVDFQGSQFDRLTPIGGRPTIYQDERGVDSTAVASQVSTDGQGYAEFYGFNFDAIVSGGGIAIPTAMDEQASIGGEVVVDPRKWGYVGDGVADDTIPIQHAIDYAELVGRSTVQLYGQPLITAKLVITADYIKIRGQGAHSTILTTSSATDPIFEVNAFSDTSFEDLTLQRTAGFAVDVVTVTGGAGAGFRARRMVVVDGGGGFTLNGGLGDVTLSDITFLGSNITTMITVTGGTSNVVLREIRGLHTTPGMTAGIILNNCNIVTLDAVVIQPVVPASQGGLGLSLITGGAGSPRDIKAINCRFSGGHAAYGVDMANGTGVTFIGCTAQDSLKNWVYTNGADMTFVACIGVDAQEENWRINTNSGTIMATACISSDCNQAGGGHSHFAIANNKTSVTILGLEIGNHIRSTVTAGLHGVNFEGISTGCTVHHLRYNSILPAGVSGDVFHLTNTAILDTLGGGNDFSHNRHGINDGTGTKANVKNHVPTRGAVHTIVSGVVMNASEHNTIVFDSAVPLNITVYSAGTEAQELLVYNKGAGTVTLTDVALKCRNIGGLPVVLATGSKVRYAYLDGLWRQVTAMQLV